MLRRCSPNAPTSPSCASTTIVVWIAAHGPLRDDATVSQAAQVVWTLTSPEVHLLMRDTGGWSKPSYRGWLEQALADGILRKG